MLKWSMSLDRLTVGMVGTSRGPIEVARTGTGPAVLLVHGIPGSWRQAVPLAEDLVSELCCILPSRPGYGATPLHVGRTYDEQADAYASLLDTLGLDRCAIVGISGGGPSAAAFAFRYPGRTSALVLACAIAAPLILPPRSWRLLKVPLLAEVLTPLTRVQAQRNLARSEKVEAEVRKGLTADELSRVEADPRIKADLMRHALSHIDAPARIAGMRNDYAQVESARTTRPALHGVACPALVLHGDADTVVPIDHARHYADVLRARIIVYGEAGHLFLLTRRSESSAAILGFLRESSI